MGNAPAKKDIYLDLNINDNGFGFAASIDDALAQAEAELVVLNETAESIKELRPQCDKLDYILAAGSGALCGVMDVFLVGKPGESPVGDLTDRWFANRTMDFAKLCHPDKKEFDSLESALRFLEKEFKVPYDQTGLGDAGRAVFGMNAKNHHFKSLGHNPSLLGLFFSILDQFSDTSHFISDGQLISLQQADDKWELKGSNIPSKLFCGFVNWFGHLVSDVSGSSSGAGKRGMGIPSPLWTWTNDLIAIKAKLGLSVTETDKAVNELALEIFEKGYNKLNKTTLNVSTFEDTFIEGRFTANSDCILYTSIPYDKGWSVVIDGEEVDSENIVALADAFIAVKVSKGNHDISFSYTPQGLSTGIKITTAALLLVAIYILLVVIFKKKGVKSKLPSYAKINNNFTEKIMFEANSKKAYSTETEVKMLPYPTKKKSVEKEIIYPPYVTNEIQKEIISPKQNKSE